MSVRILEEQQNIVRRYECLYTRSGLVIWFIAPITRSYKSLPICTNHNKAGYSSHSLTCFTCRCSAAASSYVSSPFPGFPDFSRPQLVASSSNWTSGAGINNSLTLWLIETSLALPKTSRHEPHRKHCFSVAVQLICSCLLAEPLPSNDCCIAAYLVVLTYQTVSRP
jgi:hypothetical protein